jgi:hypothetical protein
MSETDNQNLTQFESEVQHALEDLLQMDIPDWISPHRGAPELYDDDVQAFSSDEYATPRRAKLKWFSRKHKDQSSFDTEVTNEIEENADKAQVLLNRKSVRDHICPVLTKGANDFFDIAKSITPVLVGASIAGTLPFPLNPLIVALMALIIARIGIDRLCKDNVEVTKGK